MVSLPRRGPMPGGSALMAMPDAQPSDPPQQTFMQNYFVAKFPLSRSCTQLVVLNDMERGGGIPPG